MEEDFVGSLLNAFADTVFFWEPATGKAVRWNEAFRKATGYSDEEIASLKAPDSYYSQEDLSRAGEAVQRIVRDGRGTVELTLLTKDGTAIPFEYCASVVPDQEGAPRWIVSIGRDITERTRAEEALRASSARQEAILQTVPEIIAEVDSNRVYTWVNQAGRQFFGDDVIGREAAFYFVGAQDTYANVESLFEGSTDVFYVESLQRRQDGEKRLLAWWCRALKDEDGNVSGALSAARDITESRQAEEALRESEEKFRQVFEASNVGKSLTLISGEVIPNRAFCEMLGYSMEELSRKTWREITPADDIAAIERLLEPMLNGQQAAVRFNKRYLHKDGSIVWGDVSAAIRRDAEGRSRHFITTVVDITARKRTEAEREKLQAQLIQAQKMESVGRLAGGVAHDFNNMLMVVLGHVELALKQTGPDELLHADLEEIRKAAQRSADLTRQLLAFARKQTAAPKELDLNEAVEGILKMLRRLIGEDIDLAWLPGGNVGPVFIDPSQVDQILANLCVNARDAIAGVGRITIETDSVRLDEAYCARHAGVVPGEFVMLVVSDDGRGMDAETRSHLFEPFFTTKELGKGTGLGLATVYGVVTQNNGFINVYSEPDHGTTFKIYLPRHAAKAPPRPETEQAPARAAGGKTILLVEDEPAILKVTTRMLEGMGHAAIAAATPGEAIRLAREHQGQIDMLMTDVVMPEMNGRDLARNLMSIYPGIRRLFTSGYTANVIAHRGVLDEGVHFIEKPFSMQDLAAKIREALDRE